LVQKGGDDDETKEEREKLSLAPVAKYLSGLLGQDVIFGGDCIGPKAEEAVASLPADGGGVVVLENLRFYKDEEKNEAKFASALAALADGYVNDAFGTSHRAHASVAGVPALLDAKLCGVGLLVNSEVAYLDFSSLKEGESVAAIIGGSKVSTKLPVIQGLLNQVDTLVLGGGLAYTFAKAQGIPIGDSLCEESMVDTAKDLLKEADEKGKNFILPIDAVCSQTFPSQPMTLADTKTFDMVPGAGIEDGWMGLDVGPKTVALFAEQLSKASKIVFNGPMGVFEVVPFDEGTKGLVDTLEILTKNGVITVVGGGDSVAALEQFGKTDAVSYVSTGGGATLELLAGDELPGVVAIEDISI
jgi:phosphoglycerate kinase